MIALVTLYMYLLHIYFSIKWWDTFKVGVQLFYQYEYGSVQIEIGLDKRIFTFDS